MALFLRKETSDVEDTIAQIEESESSGIGRIAAKSKPSVEVVNEDPVYEFDPEDTSYRQRVQTVRPENDQYINEPQYVQKGPEEKKLDVAQLHSETGSGVVVSYEQSTVPDEFRMADSVRGVASEQEAEKITKRMFAEAVFKLGDQLDPDTKDSMRNRLRLDPRAKVWLFYQEAFSATKNYNFDNALLN